jgi:hypothetical protein
MFCQHGPTWPTQGRSADENVTLLGSAPTALLAAVWSDGFEVQRIDRPFCGNELIGENQKKSIRPAISVRRSGGAGATRRSSCPLINHLAERNPFPLEGAVGPGD